MRSASEGHQTDAAPRDADAVWSDYTASRPAGAIARSA